MMLYIHYLDHQSVWLVLPISTGSGLPLVGCMVWRRQNISSAASATCSATVPSSCSAPGKHAMTNRTGTSEAVETNVFKIKSNNTHKGKYHHITWFAPWSKNVLSFFCLHCKALFLHLGLHLSWSPPSPSAALGASAAGACPADQTSTG